MANILITGGTGFIGKSLTTELLKRGHELTVLTRDPSKYTPVNRMRYAAWDIGKGYIDEDAVKAADAIVHLAGAGVADKRWTDQRKKEILNSRVKSGQLLCKALSTIPNHIGTVVSASAIGWYGPDPQVPNPQPFKESDPAAHDFLGQTCLAWERSMEPIPAMGKRLVLLRTGIVLHPDGGALEAFMKPLKMGVAAILGSGEQVISWIHLEDMVQLYVHAVESQEMSGVYNAVAPYPVNNRTLTVSLAKSKHGNAFITMRVPAFFLKLALGEMSMEILKSATVSSSKLSSAGFKFAYPTIDEAMHAFFRK